MVFNDVVQLNLYIVLIKNILLQATSYYWFIARNHSRIQEPWETYPTKIGEIHFHRSYQKWCFSGSYIQKSKTQTVLLAKQAAILSPSLFQLTSKNNIYIYKLLYSTTKSTKSKISRKNKKSNFTYHSKTNNLFYKNKINE